MTSRLFVFTFNNYDEEQIREAAATWQDYFTYLGFGEEIAPTTGTPHLQGLVRFANSCRPAGASRELGRCFSVRDGQHIHVERARGTFAQAKAYCSKEGRFQQFGQEPAQGKRTDLSIVTEKLSNGESMESAIQEHPAVFVRCYKGLVAYQQLLQPRRDFKTKVIWCYGPTGTGKSRWCHEQAPEAYWKDGRSKWWDGYSNQPDVIIDDFRPNKELSMSYILRLFDRYPFQVEGKGTTMQFNSRRIFVTAPWDPRDTYTLLPFEVKDEDIRQVCRRVDEVHSFPDMTQIFPRLTDAVLDADTDQEGQGEENS